MNADELVIHHALTRLLAPREHADLTARIVAAWKRQRERGGAGLVDGAEQEPGTGAELEAGPGRGPGRSARVAQDDPHQRPRPRRFPHPALALAAGLTALVAAGLLLRAALQPGAEPAVPGIAAPTGPGPLVAEPGATPLPLARASSPLVAFDELDSGRGTSEAATLLELFGGERVTVAPEAGPAVLALAAGGELTAWPGAVLSLRLRDDRLEVLLEAGSVRLVTPAAGADGPRSIDAGFARLEADAGSVVVAHVEADDPEAPPADTLALARAPEAARLFTVEVSAGSAELEGPQGPRALDERAATAVSSAPEGSSLALEERVALVGRLLAVVDALDARPGAAVDPAARAEADRELLAWLDARPTRWVQLRGALDAALDARPPWYARSVLRVVTEADHPRALVTARGLWRDHPEAFGPDELIGLAARGAFELERELRARVAAWPPPAGPGPDLPPAQEAAWLARAGDDAGRAALEEAAALEDTYDRALAARAVGAAGLAELGQPAALDRAIESLARLALASLDAGAPDDAGAGDARAMGALADLLARQRAGVEPLPLANLWQRVDLHVERERARLGAAADLRRTLEGLLPD